MTATVGSDLWTDPDHSPSAVAALAATRATTFIRAQVMALRRALAWAGDRIAVDIVITAHDLSHERWVRVVNHVRTHLGEDAGLQVSAVYQWVGHTAQSLENGAIDLLDADLATRAREVASSHLDAVAEQAVEALWRIAAEFDASPDGV
ncbi:MAG: hypothetical protein GEU74_11460 [Nitriliruptorales bacterium]|nr:hypothetical protein [Nitriliruptorales bacterium]